MAAAVSSIGGGIAAGTDTTQDVLYEVMTLMVKNGPLSLKKQERLELKA